MRLNLKNIDINKLLETVLKYRLQKYTSPKTKQLKHTAES